MELVLNIAPVSRNCLSCLSILLDISRKFLKVGAKNVDFAKYLFKKKVNFLRDTFGEYTLHILFFLHNITSLDQVCTDNSSSRGPLLPQTSSPNFENGYFLGQKIIKKSTFSKFGNFIPGTFQTLNLRVGLFLWGALYLFEAFLLAIRV